MVTTTDLVNYYSAIYDGNKANRFPEMGIFSPDFMKEISIKLGVTHVDSDDKIIRFYENYLGRNITRCRKENLENWRKGDKD